MFYTKFRSISCGLLAIVVFVTLAAFAPKANAIKGVPILLPEHEQIDPDGPQPEIEPARLTRDVVRAVIDSYGYLHLSAPSDGVTYCFRLVDMPSGHPYKRRWQFCYQSDVGLSQPFAFAFDGERYLYYSDVLRGHIVKEDLRAVHDALEQHASPKIDSLIYSRGYLSPRAVALADDGTLFVADDGGHAIYAVDTDGQKRRIVGTGVEGSSPDGVEVERARIRGPRALGFMESGRLVFVDMDGIKTISPGGTLETLAGRGESFPSKGPIPAEEACFGFPTDIAVYGDDILVSDSGRRAIYHLSLKTRKIRKLAAEVIQPTGLTITADDRLIVTQKRKTSSDSEGGRVVAFDLKELLDGRVPDHEVSQLSEADRFEFIADVMPKIATRAKHKGRKGKAKRGATARKQKRKPAAPKDRKTAPRVRAAKNNLAAQPLGLSKKKSSVQQKTGHKKPVKAAQRPPASAEAASDATVEGAPELETQANEDHQTDVLTPQLDEASTSSPQPDQHDKGGLWITMKKALSRCCEQISPQVCQTHIASLYRMLNSVSRPDQCKEVVHPVLVQFCWMPKKASDWNQQWDNHIVPRHGCQQNALRWERELGRPKSFFEFPEGQTDPVTTASRLLKRIRAMVVKSHGNDQVDGVVETRIGFVEHESGSWRIVIRGSFDDIVGRTDVRSSGGRVVSCPSQQITVVFALDESKLSVITAFPS